MFRAYLLAVRCSVVVAVFGGFIASGQAPPSPTGDLKLPTELAPNFGPDEVNQIFANLPMFRKDQAKAAVQEKSRAFSENLYERAAPAVCVVQLFGGNFGTGFFIHPDGWLITNDHVVRSGHPDPQTGALMVYIHRGVLNSEGEMVLTQQKIPALVYKTSVDRDLALVKIRQAPPVNMPFLSLADEKIKVGSDCTAIGHPSVGVLWTVRNGNISGIGTFPDGRVDFYLHRVWSSDQGAKDLKTSLQQRPTRKVLISDIGIGPGDSGGPLLNHQGKVVGVTFAFPNTLKGESFHTFSYHVHANEVKAFVGELAGQPAVPPPFVPSPFPPDPFYALLDLDKDGKPDTVAIGPRPGEKPTAVLFDLTQSNSSFPQAALFQAVRTGQWKFQFALCKGPVTRAFYDTDNDGKINLILTALAPNPDKAVSVLRRSENRWIVEAPMDRKLINPQYFKDEQLQSMLQKLASKW